MWPSLSAEFVAAESQACADAAAEHVRSLEDQNAALMAEMEEAAASAETRLEAERKAAADAQAASQQQQAQAVKELQAEIAAGQVACNL